METTPKLIQGFHLAVAGELYNTMFDKQMRSVFIMCSLKGFFSVILVRMLKGLEPVNLPRSD